MTEGMITLSMYIIQRYNTLVSKPTCATVEPVNSRLKLILPCVDLLITRTRTKQQRYIARHVAVTSFVTYLSALVLTSQQERLGQQHERYTGEGEQEEDDLHDVLTRVDPRRAQWALVHAHTVRLQEHVDQICV